MTTHKPHRVLYIAYHYPPILGSSGVHRTLAFTRHLSEQGWEVDVLTCSLKAYDNWSADQFDFIPQKVNVIRAFGRNVTKHFSWRGKYLGIMALPDNWQSWIIGGFIAGLWSILKKKPDVIVSTYPIASAHIIAYLLHKITGVPWVADLRDPMAQGDYPTNKRKKKIFEWVEGKIVKHCKAAVVTTPGAKIFYQQKFPQIADAFWQVIANGFDEMIFAQAERENVSKKATKNMPLQLLHSGLIYPSERDPTCFFQAISELKKELYISAQTLNITLRASGHENIFQQKIDELDIADIVQLHCAIDYKQALQEMLNVDALLLLQAANCDYQIPAKAYEYIRTQKPVLGLTSTTGDTGQLLAKVGLAEIAPLDDKNGIKQAILELTNKLQKENVIISQPINFQQYSRQYQALVFEKLISSF